MKKQTQNVVIDGIEPDNALAMLSGDVNKYRSLVLSFVDDHRGDLAQLYDSTDTAWCRARLHALAGVAGNIGALELRVRCQDLQLSLTEDSGHCPQQNHWRGFQIEFCRVFSAFELWLDTKQDTVESSETRQLSDKQKRVVLQAMYAKVQSNHFNFERELADLQYFDEDQHIESLRDSINSFDFDKAKEEIEFLLKQEGTA